MSACSACDFASDYEIGQSPLLLEVEERMRGIAYGGTSWTTRVQAEMTADRLGLGSGRRLLELGAGAGWPALFLATVSGCEVVLTDLPLSGLRVARARAVSAGLDKRFSVLAADGTALPFADHAFERIHHADVLCCMERKRELLRECRRVGSDGAEMELSVIALAREPSNHDERCLLEKSGPPYPDAGGDYAALLLEAGWDLSDRIDVTSEFSRCIDLLIQAWNSRRDALLALLGEENYAEQLEKRVSARGAVACGLLKRETFLARRR